MGPQKTSTTHHALVVCFILHFSILSFLIQQIRAVTSWENKSVTKSWPLLSWTDFPMKVTVKEIQNPTNFTWHISELRGKKSCTLTFKILKMLLSCFSLQTSCLGGRLYLILWALPPNAFNSSLPSPPCFPQFNFFCLWLGWNSPEKLLAGLHWGTFR